MLDAEQDNVRLTVEGPTGVLLQCGGLNVLTPTSEGERAMAFDLLTRALATLAGISPSCEAYATEAVTGARSEESEPHSDHHTSGNVVPLRGRRVGTTLHATPE